MNIIPNEHTLEQVSHEFLSKLPGHLPMPKFELKSDYHSAWLGKCEWMPGERNTTIFVQKSIFADKDTLRRVVAHELCHHCDYLTNELPAYEKDPKTFSIHERYRDGHGSSFHKIASLLNSVYGKNFVVDKSDLAMDLEKVPEYTVLLMRDKGNRIYWAVAEHPSEEQLTHIADLLTQKFDHREYKLTKSTDPLLAKGSSIGESFSTPKPGKDPVKNALVSRLVELWKNGETVTPPHVAHSSEEDSIFVPRERKVTIFAQGSVYYVAESFSSELGQATAYDKYNLIAGPLAARNVAIVKPIMEGRIAAKLPKNLKLKVPGQLYGSIELEFCVPDTDISFLVIASARGEIKLDLMEGSNRHNVFTRDMKQSLWEAAPSQVFTAIFVTIKHALIEQMRQLGMQIIP